MTDDEPTTDEPIEEEAHAGLIMNPKLFGSLLNLRLRQKAEEKR